MTCREFHWHFPSLAFGDLPPGECARAQRHLRLCPACARKWQEYQRLIELARRLPPEPLPAELGRQLRAACVLVERLRRDAGSPPPA